ncbi:MAG: hypothetical protein IKI75_01120 [Lachnospiraceae bacterium]|nr:hypothetical protein [Lachnospiraceae bacterium]
MHDIDLVNDTFVDFSSLDERMKDGNTITCEFKSAKGKWRRGRFIVSGRLQDGSISNVMYQVEDIDAEKEERERLINASERALAASEAKSLFLSNDEGLSNPKSWKKCS